jgi:hypothetical protein
MKFAVLAALCASASAFPFVARQTIATAAQIAALAPALGGLPDTNPNSGGDCDGPRQANGQIPRVPCACPPLQDAYIKALTTNVLAGHAVNNTVVNVSFPTGDTVQDKHGRITAAIITLQNLNGPGKGCPGVSTTLGIQSNNLDTCGDFECGGSSSAPAVSSSTANAVTTSTPAPVAPANAVTTSTPAPVAPAASTSSAATVTATGALTLDLVNQLAPDLGGQPNTNPNSAGDCDGPRQPNGQIPKVPCACPPLRTEYVNQLFANIQAGHAVNNPSVRVSFPTGNTVQNKHDRITAAVITLQNLNGPGKGCPTVSTTLPQQSNNLDQCGDFTCGASSNNGTTTTSASTSAPTAPPQNGVNQANVAIQNAASTVTVTVQTVVTDTVTVTAGQGTTSTPAAVVAAAIITSTSAAAATSTTTAAASNGNGTISRALVDQLAPQLGSQPNNNPNQFGDCDGPRQPNGQIPRVPCACPPVRSVFIDQLLANIEAGHAVNNPTVKLSFPTSNSKADQHARITAGTITLQNLNGPGKGCPNVSTTFAAQSNAIGN